LKCRRGSTDVATPRRQERCGQQQSSPSQQSPPSQHELMSNTSPPFIEERR